MKKLGKFIIVLIAVFSLSFITLADTDLGMGKVTAVKKVGDINYTPDTNTVKGTFIGMGVGAGAGFVSGAIAEGSFFVASAPFIIAPIAVIAAAPVVIGGSTLIGATIGAVIGTGSGYVWGLHKKGLGVFKITVRPDKSGSKSVTFHQNLTSNVRPGQEVKLMENDVCWFIPDGNYIKQ